MVLDTSALLAILCDEPERRSFNEAIEAADERELSAAGLVETAIVLEHRFGPEGVRDLDLFITRAQIGIAPVDSDQAHAARAAYARFGKGRHAAGLNFGDCFAYALAKTRGDCLLFKGLDFARTDIRPCLESSRPPMVSEPRTR